ncbi:MAG: VOC family protein [Burkholderiaceae bacterium]
MSSPLWPARLDHVSRESDQPEALVTFYTRTLGLRSSQLNDDCWALTAPGRRLLIKRGRACQQPTHGFRLGGTTQVSDLRRHCTEQGIACEPTDNPFLADAFAVTDPDNRQAVFGLDKWPEELTSSSASALPGRLQHVVIATRDLSGMVAFYQDKLGFRASDHVYDGLPADGKITATFLRSDPEHHSFAAFLSPENRADHLSFETNEWNDIRDWADHMAGCGIRLWWGPGRHGPGNNLFFMIEDPEGYKLELSAEIEHLTADVAPRSWTHEERTLNLWGNAWMRS